MSSTAREIIEMAMRRINVVSRDEAMQADDAAHALKAMNMMMHGWAARGADINHFDYSLTTQVQLPDELHDGLVHLLAVRLAKDFSVPLPTSDGFDYRQWWQSVLTAYIDTNPIKMDAGLRNLPSQRRTNASV